MFHTPVLLNQTINLLNIKKDGVYVDCTAGFGGHSDEILKKLSPKGKLICIDQDIDAINYLNEKFKNNKNVKIFHTNFKNIKDVVKEKVDGILLDLGVSSFQLDNLDRGFSYHNNAQLDMRMDQVNNRKTAKTILNKYKYDELRNVFKAYGDAKNVNLVIKKIKECREKKIEINSTKQFVDLIKSTLNAFELRSQKHPAKVYFQALRIEVNDEINVLKKALLSATDLLNKNGRLVVITFHSLEEKIVKNFMAEITKNKIPSYLPTLESKIDFVCLTKKPILPDEEELENNKRSHSAKLWGVAKN